MKWTVHVDQISLMIYVLASLVDGANRIYCANLWLLHNVVITQL